MKKFHLLIFTILCFFTFGSAKANTLDSIETTVYIDQNGNGHVTEVWTLDANEGTESYHSFGNMTDREITNFTVSMDGTNYQTQSYWNVNASKDQKAYKNGINYTSDGLELCWGIEYGTHTYEINYTIENLVWQYDDNQILYFSFLPQNMDPAPKSYKITFQTGNPLSDIKYSSYGFKSNNNLSSEEITMQSDGSMASKEYVVALIGFPNNTFNLNISRSGTYDDVASEALEGATLNEENDVPWFAFICVFALIIFIIYASKKSGTKYDKSEFILPKKKDIPNFRDIPFDKNIIKAYFIGEEEGIMEEKYIMSAILLKWIKENKITMVPTEGGVIDFNKDDNFYIDITNLKYLDNAVEASLSSILKGASQDNKVYPKEFKKFTKNNYKRINDWLDLVKNTSKNLLITDDYLVSTTKKRKTLLKFTPKLKDEYLKLYGLKKFLEDMSNIEEKRAIEVHIWDEYLIFASAFGIADKVAKQFKEFHAEEFTNDPYYYNFYNSYYWATTFSSLSVREARSAEYAASARSGGSFSGGGFSSGGFSSGGGGVR